MTQAHKDTKQYRLEHLQEPVPANARFVNETELTDEVLYHGALLSSHKGIRALYLIMGIALIVGAVVLAITNHDKLIASVLIGALGLLFILQTRTLERSMVQKNRAQLDRMGPDASRRVLYFTNDEVGACLPGGEIRTFPYSEFSRFICDDRVFGLVHNDGKAIMIIDKYTFLKGTEESFAKFISQKVGDLNYIER